MIMPISLNAGGFYLMSGDEPYGCASDIAANQQIAEISANAEAARPAAQTRCGLIPLWRASASVAEWGIIRFQSLNTRCLSLADNGSVTQSAVHVAYATPPIGPPNCILDAFGEKRLASQYSELKQKGAVLPKGSPAMRAVVIPASRSSQVLRVAAGVNHSDLKL